MKSPMVEGAPRTAESVTTFRANMSDLIRRGRGGLDQVVAVHLTVFALSKLLFTSTSENRNNVVSMFGRRPEDKVLDTIVTIYNTRPMVRGSDEIDRLWMQGNALAASMPDDDPPAEER